MMNINYETPPIIPTTEIITGHPNKQDSSASLHVMSIGSDLCAGIITGLQNTGTTIVQTYQEAAYRLQHLPPGPIKFPDAIIGTLDTLCQSNLKDFTKFLNADRRLQQIPFILIDNNDTDSPAGNYHFTAGIDDIVSSNISANHLYRKICLLKKFKSLKKLELSQIKPSDNQIHSDRKIVYKIDAIFKRLMDILIAGLTLIIISPLVLIISIIIKIDSRGPVFYTSYRAGSNYRIFKFIKFRTMITEADHNLSQLMTKNQYKTLGSNHPVFFKISNDPRITHFGKFLRNSSLDEIPQLLNVLKGDMSLVGNRPLPLYEARELTTDRHAERFNAPAGITGLWQISKRGQKEMSAEERIALDIDYARNNSFTKDFLIILKTPRALAQKDNV